MAGESSSRSIVRGPRPWDSALVRLAIGAAVIGAALWAYSHNSPKAAETFGTFAPALTRFAVSFLGGFTLGWIMRRFVKWSLLIVAVLGLGIFALKKTGMIDLPWDQIQGDVKEGSTWLQAQAGSAKKFITGYLPSGFAAIVGGFFGFRR